MPKASAYCLTLAFIFAWGPPAQAFEECSPEQLEIFQAETPYPRMMSLTQTMTLATLLSAAFTPNTEGQLNPTWLAGYGIAWLNGVFKGPSCRDIPAHYVDGDDIALEKTAFTPDASVHEKMLGQFAKAYIVDIILLSGMLYDTQSPTIRSMALLSVAAPVIAYSLHEWNVFQRRNTKTGITGVLLPDTKAGHLRATIGFITEFP